MPEESNSQSVRPAQGNVTREELAAIEAFNGLAADELDWFLSQSEEQILPEGTVYYRPGDEAAWMFVLLEGALQGRSDEPNGETIVFEITAGQVSGRLPFSRMKKYAGTIRALARSRAVRFPEAKFPELVQRMPELTSRLVGVMSDRIRYATRQEQQRDKLAALGKLSAGLAHELNNPASAAKRSASQLREALQRIRDASHDLGSRDLTPTQKKHIENLEAEVVAESKSRPDSLAASDLEDKLESLFRSHGFDDMWQLSADLAQRGVQPAIIEPIFSEFDAATARAALTRIATSIEIWSLLAEVESAASRISDLVKAIKEYTYMDQSVRQDVDIVKGLETTLTILNHKLKKGVTVTREYQPMPLLVNSFGSELNQVWTNLIDNAIDAMNGQGELAVRTYREDKYIVVEIEDHGPGIPPELQPRLFEPFFTTKAVGQGTGLGLDTVRRIVRKHNGDVSFRSGPRGTCFQVRLLISSVEPRKTIPAS